MQLDETTLLAYVDGNLSSEEARAVELALAQDPEARAQVRRLSESAALLGGALDVSLFEPVPERLVAAIEGAPTAAAPGGRPAWRWLAAAAIVCALSGVVGAALGYYAAVRQTERRAEAVAEDWMLTYIAQYHRVYARERLHLVEVDASRTPHIETWLGNRLERPLTVPDLSTGGLAFKGARLLVFDGKPVAQLMYAPAEGPPVALCITKTEGEQSPASLASRDDLNLLYWSDGGYRYVLVGWLDEPRLKEMAAEARGQL